MQVIWLGLLYEVNVNWKWLNLASYNYSNWAISQPADPNTYRCAILNTDNNGKWKLGNVTQLRLMDTFVLVYRIQSRQLVVVAVAVSLLILAP